MALTTDLISYWKLDVDSSTQDDSHGSNDGTVNGATYTASGKINGAYSFDGINDYILTGLNMSAGNTSISFWVYFNASGNDYCLNIGGDSSARHGWFIYWKSNDVFEFWTSNASGIPKIVTFATGAISKSAWHHIVFTWDGSTTASNVKIYVDGSVTSGSGNVETWEGLSDNDGLTIGRTSVGINAILDEVGIWNRVLTSDEVTALYNSGDGLAYPFSTGLQLNIGDVWKAVAAVKINIGDAWKVVPDVKVNIADAWK